MAIVLDEKYNIIVFDCNRNDVILSNIVEDAS